MSKPRKHAGASWKGPVDYGPMRKLTTADAAGFTSFMSPWVGARYEGVAPRVLVVGESAFRHDGDFMPASWQLEDYSRWCVELARDGKPHPFWTKLCSLLRAMGVPGDGAPGKRPELDHIVYFLAVPGILESRLNRDLLVRQRGFVAAHERLKEMITTHRPDRVLILGKETASLVTVRELATENAPGLWTLNHSTDGVRLGVLTHPQSPHYRKAAALDLVRRLAA